MNSEEKTPINRLIVSKLVLQNFKSYGGTRVLGPFHRCFNAIVGPNGSGKSNLIDALLFVFGFKSARLRSDNISKLIHNSTEYHCESCKASVHFDEITPNGDIVPDSSFELSRVGYSNNSSNYYFNNNKISHKEVEAKLKQYGIDLDNNRFLILQGEIESIALKKPKATNSGSDDGLLEYIEDIIGTTHYAEIIQKKETEIDSLSTAKANKVRLVQIVENDKNSLLPNKNECIEYIKKEIEIDKKEILFYQILLNNLQIESTSTDDKYNIYKTKLGELEKEISNFENSLNEKKSHSNDVQKEFQRIKKLVDQIKERAHTISMEDVKDKENIKMIKERIKKLTSNTKKEADTKEKKEATIIENKKEIEKLQKSLPKLELDKKNKENAFNQQYETLKEKNSELHSKIHPQIEAKEKELIGLKSEESKLQAKYNFKDRELNLLLEKQTKSKESIGELKESINENKTKVQQTTIEIEEFNNEISKIQDLIKDDNNKLKELDNEEKKCHSILKVKREQLLENKDVINSVGERGDKIIQQLQENVNNKKNDNIVYDRLGNLGYVDEKYDIAISTACALLDYIVVNSKETGQKCIEYLRSHHLGVKNFLVLSELRQPAPASNIPSTASRALDLITLNDKKFLPAFSLGLGNVLVVNNLSDGLALFNSGVRYHIVSLDGKIIDASGTMSGGGRSFIKGRILLSSFSSSSNTSSKSAASFTSITNSIATLENELKELNEQLQTIRNERNNLVKSINSNNLRSQQVKLQLKKTTSNLKNLHNEETEIQRALLEEQKSDKILNENDNFKVKLKQELQGIQKQLDEKRIIIESVKDKLSSLQNIILEHGGNKLQELKLSLDETVDKYTRAKKTINKCEIENDNIIKSLKKKTTQISDIKEEKKRLEEELHSTENRNKDITAEIEKTSADLEKQDKSLNIVSSELNELKEEYSKEKKKLDKLVGLKEELVEEIEGIQKLLTDNKNKISTCSNKLEKHIKKCEENFRIIQNDMIEDDETEPEKEKIESKENNNQMDIEEAKINDTITKAKKIEISSENIYITYSSEELQEFNLEEIKEEVTKQKEALQKMNFNISILEDYYKKDREYVQHAKELNTIIEQFEQFRKDYENLCKERVSKFMNGFNTINIQLKEIYQVLTNGGDAELELVDSLDPFSEGVQLSIRPPKKNWKVISNLSGGEKTLSSLSLVFALHCYKATPLYIMDEIDAALDFRNVSIIANYIKERTKNAQFIIISLRNNMFELAQRLIGIYKTNNVTKSLTINPSAFAI